MIEWSGKRIDKYILIERLGEGTFGNVYKGKNIHDGSIVAVKILKFQLTPDTLGEFINEAGSMVQLEHANIVPLLHLGTDKLSKMSFLVMKYAPHGTLRQRHPVGTSVSLEIIISYVKPIADALHYVHDKKLIHRDVKPSNMLLDDNNTILLSDFGVAVTAHSEHSLSTQNMGGTLPYMAPEQIQRQACPASDQYSLAVVVYQWLCGVRPFQGSEVAVTYQHLHIAPPSLREKNPTIPPAVERVVLKALAKKPEERYPTIQAFAQALEDAYLEAMNASSAPPPTQVPPSTVKLKPVVPPLSSPSNALEAVDRTPTQPLPSPKQEEDKIPLLLLPRKPDPVPETPRVVNIPAREDPKVITTAKVPAPQRNPAPAPKTSRPPGGQPSRVTPSRRGGHSGKRSPAKRRTLLIGGLIILVLALLLCGSFALANPPNPVGKGIRGALGLSPSGTVSITPDSKPISDTYTLTGADKTDPATRTVAVRSIAGTAQSAAVQVNATGQALRAAIQAVGSLTFINDTGSVVTLPAGTTINVGGGVKFVSDKDANVPPFTGNTVGQITVTAHATPAGQTGNVGAFVLNAVGIGNGISVSNTIAFTGGQNAANYKFLQKTDVTNAVTQQMLNTTKQDALSNLSKQLHTGEQPFGATQCNPVISTDQLLGDNGAAKPVNNANVTYRMQCTSTAYDYTGAQTIASGLLAQKATATLPAGYAAVSNIQVSLINQTTANNTTSFSFSAKGLWGYQFTDQQKQNIVRAIVSKSVAEAEDVLRNTPGVGRATITIGSGNNLPADPNQLSIQVQPLTTSSTSASTAPTASALGQPTVAAPLVQGGGGAGVK